MSPSFFGELRSAIIFAADLPSFAENARILDQIRAHIDVVKINCPLLYREGVGVIGRLVRDYGLPVFADIKVADVPHTNAAIVELMAEQGAAAVMVHGIVGPDGIQAAIDAAASQLAIIVQLELTNPGGKLFTQPIAEDMAGLAKELGAFGVQAPGNRPERIQRIRSIVGPEMVIVCCGVGRQGGRFQAVRRAGGSYAIIGRAIYEADDPIAAIEELRLTPP
ncbi:MAG: orotidine-5'-phosphate decarboxylase [Myxococcota bacterium]|jgi:orotidine-5'-phosphate decarboxylase|nr:orotidine-5'-phosphate decarboxylase [Myxococcota bacterium]